MTGLAVLAAVVVAAAMWGVVYARRARVRRDRPPVLAQDYTERVEAARRAFAAAAPWQPASDPEAPPAAAAIEAALITGDPAKALQLAEEMFAADPGSETLRAWLAWALVATAQPEAALRELDRRASSAPGSSPGSALGCYVLARAQHLLFEHGAGAIGALPPLVTTADLAVMTLARGRGSAAWLQGAQDVQLSAEQVRAAVADHRLVTARCLDDALTALALAPGFADAAYLVARLAVKSGSLTAGRALYDAIAPRITGRPDADAFARDRRDLDEPEAAVAAAKQAPIPETAKRSRSLRVL